MIDFLNDYTLKILFLSIFIGIIQMILPKGKLKSNVLFTSMIVITIVIIEPIITFFNNDIDISKIYSLNTNEYKKITDVINYEKYYNEKVKNIYEENLRNDIVKRLEEAGYKINSIKCECDDETLEPKSLRLEIETEDGTVRPIRIEVSKTNSDKKEKITFQDKLKIQKIAYENYGIKSEHIFINEWKEGDLIGKVTRKIKYK